jgi:hypothetical protein
MIEICYIKTISRKPGYIIECNSEGGVFKYKIVLNYFDLISAFDSVWHIDLLSLICSNNCIRLIAINKMHPTLLTPIFKTEFLSI